MLADNADKLLDAQAKRNTPSTTLKSLGHVHFLNRWRQKSAGGHAVEKTNRFATDLQALTLFI